MDGALRTWAARRPLLVDGALAATVYLVLTLVVTTAAKSDGPWWLAWACNLAPAAPIVVRRRYPVGALAVSLSAVVVIVAVVGPVGGEAAVTVVLATAVSRAIPPLRALVAVGLAALGVVVLAALQPEPVEALFNGAVVCIAAVAAGLAARSRRGELEAVTARGAREAELAVAHERARIARELHDVVSHHVAVMVALAGGVERTATRDAAKAQKAAARIGETGREALTELRGVLDVLASTEQEPQPGTDRLPDLVAGVESSGLDARLAVHGYLTEVPPMVQLSVYRIVQEALTNTMRHARDARRVDVEVSAGEREVSVRVVDDGRVGPVVHSVEGRGLVGMRERAAVHGSEVMAGRGPAGGWQVSVTLPYEEGAAR